MQRTILAKLFFIIIIDFSLFTDPSKNNIKKMKYAQI